MKTKNIHIQSNKLITDQRQVLDVASSRIWWHNNDQLGWYYEKIGYYWHNIEIGFNSNGDLLYNTLYKKS